MISTLALTALASALGAHAAANDVSEANNVTKISGTWSTGNGRDSYISTGPGFCNPAAFTFNAPQNTGTSFSFTEDGFFEEAQFRFTANPKSPDCIAAQLWWQHGTYEFVGDSLVLSPWGQDGRIQVQNRCAPTTTQLFVYNEKTTFKDWGITVDQSTARYALRLNAWDGAKLPPLYQIANPPNMLPTEPLTGTNDSGQLNTKRGLEEKAVGAATVGVSSVAAGVGSAVAVAAVLAVTSVF